ncbi:hypothetical protein [Methylobacterium fujisawaense]|uniref:hypothetical protein n=1 Tax=Methylobacterium fujisawaense TaxID=107400 RepID=UPI00244A9005|nr:hypothetical protein [Methylobacterium fujisawaense]MDH3030153.1 hypothetical protein [Methylobacterium fujisawaense]
MMEMIMLRTAMIFVLLILSNNSHAMPWKEHKVLSNPNVRMTDSPYDRNTGQRAIRTYFEKMERWGYSCTAKDGNIDPNMSNEDSQSGLKFDRIRVLCSNKSNDKVYYLMRYFRNSHLDIDSIYVNGRKLPKNIMTDHQNAVYSEMEPTIDSFE